MGEFSGLVPIRDVVLRAIPKRQEMDAWNSMDCKGKFAEN